MLPEVTLKIIQGKLIGKTFIFNSRDTCLIGRNKKCQIKIPDDKDHSTISRYHCLLDINPPHIRIRDSGSKNGTYVNNRCIGRRGKDQPPSQGENFELEELDLKDGDLITLGNTIFEVKITEELPSPTTNKSEIDPIIPEINLKYDENLGIFNDYLKLEELGHGGFGKVHLARHKKTEELVAIKTLLPQIAVKPYIRDLFLREILVIQKLNHPNLVKFIDCDFRDSKFYFVMEFCDRGSVANLIKSRQGALSIEETSKLIFQVLDGLHYAHQKKGVIHRDIKPSNIFLTEQNGELIAKLGDYGLAKSFDLSGLSGQTATGAKMGTPTFVPKQQVIDFKYAKPDVDVWAVAATFYFMLTQAYPRDIPTSFRNDLFAVLHTKPVPIRERNSSIPKSLAQVIDLALDDDRDLYFQDALSFKNALISAL